MLVKVNVERVTLDTATSRFVVILKDDQANRWLPIVVGSTEAQAIALQLEKSGGSRSQDASSPVVVSKTGCRRPWAVIAATTRRS